MWRVPERRLPDPNDSPILGLDVFTRPSSPSLQLLPWRESSLDGLGATGKVRGRRSLWRGLMGKGREWSQGWPPPPGCGPHFLCPSSSSSFFILDFQPFPFLLPSLSPASLTSFSPFSPFALPSCSVP